jgi:hypothetical protein
MPRHISKKVKEISRGKTVASDRDLGGPGDRDTTTEKYVKTKTSSFFPILFVAVPLESSFQDGSNDIDEIKI